MLSVTDFDQKTIVHMNDGATHSPLLIYRYEQRIAGYTVKMNERPLRMGIDFLVKHIITTDYQKF